MSRIRFFFLLNLCVISAAHAEERMSDYGLTPPQEKQLHDLQEANQKRTRDQLKNDAFQIETERDAKDAKALAFQVQFKALNEAGNAFFKLNGRLKEATSASPSADAVKEAAKLSEEVKEAGVRLKALESQLSEKLLKNLLPESPVRAARIACTIQYKTAEGEKQLTTTFPMTVIDRKSFAETSRGRPRPLYEFGSYHPTEKIRQPSLDPLAMHHRREGFYDFQHVLNIRFMLAACDNARTQVNALCFRQGRQTCTFTEIAHHNVRPYYDSPGSYTHNALLLLGREPLDSWRKECRCSQPELGEDMPRSVP